jgi:hypothetical protein
LEQRNNMRLCRPIQASLRSVGSWVVVAEVLEFRFRFGFTAYVLHPAKYGHWSAAMLWTSLDAPVL